jgi:CBS domain-containing protein
MNAVVRDVMSTHPLSVRKAGDLMTSPTVTVGPADPIGQTARLMHVSGLEHLPVVDAAGRPGLLLLAVPGKRRSVMHAQVGDKLTVKGGHQGDQDRDGEIVEVIGVDGAPPYLVRWRDGCESLCFIRPVHRSSTARDRAPVTTVTAGRVAVVHSSAHQP